MIRTYTMRLKATRRQSEMLSRLLANLCELYNMALEQRRNAWKELGITVGRYEQQKQLTELRRGVAEYKEFPATIQREPLRRLERSFASFFKRCSNGERAGFPRFKKRDKYASFVVDKGKFKISEKSVEIEKLGKFFVKTHMRIKGSPLELRVKRCGQKWQAQVVCDIGPAPEKVAVRNAVGIDLGLTSLVTLSDGTEIANPRWAKQEEARLAKANRSLERKRKGSKNRLKSKEQLRRVYQKIRGLRSAYLHRVSRQLVNSYDLVAYESLDIPLMSRGNLNKAITDASWGTLIYQLKYKAEEAGTYAVAVNPRGTTQLCSGCGERVPKSRGQRQHDCPKCGLQLGRDHNAALNIRERGMRFAVLMAEG